MEGYCSTGQSPQRAVLPLEEEEEDNNVRGLSYTDTDNSIHHDLLRLTNKGTELYTSYLHNGSYMFRQDNAILRERLGSF
jgi:hypothetical protein